MNAGLNIAPLQPRRFRNLLRGTRVYLLPHCFLQGYIFSVNIFTIQQTILTSACCRISRYVFQETSHENRGIQPEIERLYLTFSLEC